MWHGARRSRWRSPCWSRSSRRAGCSWRRRSSSLWLLSPALALRHRPAARRTASRRSTTTERAALRRGRAQDLALLRGAGDAGRQLADPRQLSGGPRRRHRAPHLADQHRPAAAVDAGGARLRLPQLQRRASIGSSRRSTRCCGCSATAATSTTGTTRERSRRWRRAYISTVDSGNLAGYLLTLRSGLTRARRDARRSSTHRALEGLDDVARPVRGGDRTAGGRGGARRGMRKELAEPADAARGAGRRLLDGWRALLARHRRAPVRRSALLLHELEEPIGSTGAAEPHAADAGPKPASGSSGPRRRSPARHAELERLTGWMTRLQRAVAARPAADRADARRARRSGATAPLDGAGDAAAERRRCAPLIDERAAARGRADRARRAPRRAGRRSARGDRVRLPLQRRAAAVLDRLQRLPTAGSTTRTTTCWPRRRGSPASWPSPRARCSHEHWFKLGRSLTPSGSVARAAVVERVDVRVPDAAAGDALVSRHAARRDLRRRRAPADRVRRAARRAVGHLRVGLQRRRTSRGTISTAPSACRASA